MDDVKIKVIDSDRLINAINEGSYDVNLSAVMSTSPSAQPKRKKGEWIEHKWAEEVGDTLISNYECSKCHCWKRETSNFCPNCGSDMRGGQDGNQEEGS